MMGSMFAGDGGSRRARASCTRGRRFKIVRGMGSLSAMEEGSADRYFQESDAGASKLVPEGIEARLPYKGPVGRHDISIGRGGSGAGWDTAAPPISGN